MPKAPWQHPPRHLLILFLGIMGLLASAIGWLGWRLLGQDRAVADQQMRARLETSADAAAGELARRLASVEAALVTMASAPNGERETRAGSTQDALPPGALFAVFGDGRLETIPSKRLLFYPSLPASREPDPFTFVRGEALEFRQRDYRSAVSAYRALTQSDDPVTRAGALLRLGRVQRKAERYESALTTYDALAELDDVSVSGLPAGLIGAFARLEVLDRLGRERELQQRAVELQAALATGAWRITRPTYAFYSSEVTRWLPTGSRPTTPDEDALALADGVDVLLQRAASAPTGNGNARRDVILGRDRTVLLLWHGNPDRGAGFVATDAFVTSAWLHDIGGMLEREGMALSLTDAAGGRPAADRAETVELVRVPAQTGLPWTLQVVLTDPTALLADLGERRRLMVAGMLLIGLVILFGTYAVTRAVRREMEVARLQSEFVSAVSHEFRTPLTSMRQLSEMLSSGRVPSDERRAEYYAVISRESERLHRLVEGLLDFGRMEAGALEFIKERLVLDDLVREVVEEFRAERGEAARDVSANGAQTGAVIHGDREALTRLLWNLLDNAVKYSPDRGDVRVGVAVTGHDVSLSVRDHGSGMAADELDGVFEKFVRGSASEALNVKGTGIGLAMVRHIVEAHDGAISVESVPGEGSTFTIRLPIEETA